MASATFDRRAYLVDDDKALRNIVRKILTGSGIHTEEFDTAESFLAEADLRPVGCILLDLRLPGMSGLDLLHRLKEVSTRHPVIMVSGHGDISSAVESVKAGALDFIQKPFRKERLLRVLDDAFEIIRARRDSGGSEIEALTRRERDVLLASADGSPNKIVARRLELSVRTVEMHRANLLKRLGLKNMTQALFLAKEGGYLG